MRQAHDGVIKNSRLVQTTCKSARSQDTAVASQVLLYSQITIVPRWLLHLAPERKLACLIGHNSESQHAESGQRRLGGSLSGELLTRSVG